MQIQFDPRDRDACTGVISAIIALHGSLPFDEAVSRLDEAGLPATPQGAAHDSQDAAAAFGGVSAAAAFPTPAAPPAANEGTAVTSAPAPTPASASNGSDNGPPAATASHSNAAVETDANGMPWDARIHSGPADKRPKNADGTWRKKRGVSDDLIAQVEAELRGVMGAPAPTTEAPPAPTTEAPPAPTTEAPPAPTGNAPAAAAPAPVPAAAVPTPAPTAPSPTPADAGTAYGAAAATPAASEGVPATFADLMRIVTAKQTAGDLTVAQTGEIAVSLGLGGMRDLMHRPDLVPSFYSLLPGVA